MPVSPSQLNTLLQALHDPAPLPSYRAAATLEKLKPEMSDPQRAEYEAALASASQQRQQAAKAREEAETELLDDWDKESLQWK
ncbi:hypothetical protein ABHF33_04715 [Chitinibacter sp. FCG-7]|uniref:Uncharacterized protein n=1 Tax=Chitinibacter mangrovi TaxID=3153927 RepID=A0AAU7FD53_9NEIS